MDLHYVTPKNWGIVKKSFLWNLKDKFHHSIKKSSIKSQLISKGLFDFLCHRFDQKTNEIILRISALASKKSSNQKPKYKYVK